MAHDPVFRVVMLGSELCALNGVHDDLISSGARPELHPLRSEPLCCTGTGEVSNFIMFVPLMENRTRSVPSMTMKFGSSLEVRVEKVSKDKRLFRRNLR